MFFTMPDGEVNLEQQPLPEHHRVGISFNGAYYVTRVSHVFDCGAYTQKFEARRNALGMTGTEVFVQV
jgi:hypothetical protein